MKVVLRIVVVLFYLYIFGILLAAALQSCSPKATKNVVIRILNANEAWSFQ